jgi:hypothetical protein
MMKSLAFLLVLVAMHGQASATSRVKLPVMVGNWYGEGQPNDPNTMWLAHIAPDGKFSAQFRSCVRGKPVDEQTIAGSWTYHDGQWELVTTLVNGITINSINIYKTLSYDGRKHVYRHLQTNYVFTAVRVKQDYKLPSCNLSS